MIKLQKLLTVIAISAFVFTFSAYAGETFHEKIVNNTNNVIHITPTHHSRIHHPSHFKVILNPGEKKIINFSVMSVSIYSDAYIDQHISIAPPYIGKHSKCFRIEFYTAEKLRGDEPSDKNRIRHCGTKNSMFSVYKSGNHEHYTIYVSYNKNALKLKK